MILPPDIISTATLGTDQSAFTPLRVDGPLGDLLGKLDSPSPEMALLITAASLKLYAQAGWIAPRATRPLSEPCPLDESPTCGRRALRQLMVMLEGHYPEALPEWLRQLAHQGKRIPEEALPLILEAGRKHAHLRDLILPVIGQRGHWLAFEVTNRQWNWFAPQQIERTWERGSSESRADLIKLLRQSDPALARALVTESWPGEKSAERALFLRQFEHGLTMEDEPFLEAALNDRGGAVRSAAVPLLARLPDSRFRERMRARAAPLLSLERAGLRRKTLLEIRPCPAYDPTMERDGVERDPPVEDLPAPFWWTQNILRWAAPSFWCAEWQISLEALIEVARGSKAPFRLVDVLVEAAYYTGEFDILFALLRNLWPDLSGSLVERTAGGLTDLQRETLAVEILQSHPEGFHRGHPAEPVLNSIEQGWSRELSDAFVASLKRYLQKQRVRPDPDTRSMLLRFARHISLDDQERFLLALDVRTSANEVWQEMLDEIRLLLDFRHDMFEAIRGND